MGLHTQGSNCEADFDQQDTIYYLAIICLDVLKMNISDPLVSMPTLYPASLENSGYSLLSKNVPK